MKALEVLDVSKSYSVDAVRRYRTFSDITRSRKSPKHVALDGISFSVDEGESVGIIGRNGSGKSTLLRVIAGVTSPTKGIVRLHQPVTGFLTIASSTMGDMSGRENAYTAAMLAGLERRQARERLDEIADFAELGNAFDDPLRTYSDGMKLRLSFAVSVAIDPQILMVDEVLAVGDSKFAQKCLQRLVKLQEKGVTTVVVSHSMQQVTSLCERALWIDGGKLLMDDRSGNVCAQYTETIERLEGASTGSQGELLDVGNSLVEISHVNLTREDGSPASVISGDDPLAVDIFYSSAEEADLDVIFCVSIGEVGTGNRIVNLNTELDLRQVVLKGGTGRMRLKIAPMKLSSGDYAVDVGVYRSDWSETLDFQFEITKFTVIGPWSPGTMLPDHRWVLPRENRSS
jgi:lipopolysaccharide transport system ATP-binding protein